MSNLKTVPSRVLQFSSPTAQRSERVENFRETAVEHLVGHDTRVLEALLAVLMLLNGLQIMELDSQAAWLAPFIRLTKTYLYVPEGVWVALFLGVGMWKGFSVFKGWKNNNCLNLRGKSCLVGSVLWAVIMLAIIAHGQPPMIVMRYLAYACCSMFCCVVLTVKDKKLPDAGCG